MDTKTKLISAAEQLFDRHGFTATGMDKLTKAAGMSSRTLYKHAGSKTALITEVLKERHRRFQPHIEVGSVDALFDALEEWIRSESARGCLFLRAYGETGGDTPAITEAVLAHKTRLYEKIQDIVAIETDGQEIPELAEQILILYEGATAAAIYRGPEAIASAHKAASALLKQARS
ncbi:MULTISPECIES: TetR/AcrR family transcriptional regulator [Halomonadaceae]|jgi:AcrR family transcriptional regulator|uniref:TetR/AcrR family transcriptional regulator n=1 Tax=Halomonadaceae TaxID=28256 RepID=UPI0012F3C684|nr:MULTISPECIES: TetR/AcrR family transcriptional regulator [Halomonas]CAD5275339.1 TetR family transcriptional regulator [Halomonas sp. 156]CAD5276575.1 TetR family transcriptional regulator [Halomonas sp. 113]CAD5278071.1 TetR family transcriptional regulator [Halomonas sp. 59]CAD5283680.1 TetR family transcriptional regulator [Halomonas sp. I3]VXC03838.1 TetR family transcriptional regulator [Halomonas titanicae]